MTFRERPPVQLKGMHRPVRPIEVLSSANETGIDQPRDVESPIAVVTVMFTNIIGSTELASRLRDEEWSRLLDRYHARTYDQVAAFGGRVIDDVGDSVLAVFDRHAKAVESGLAIIESLREYDLRIGIGLHTGECRLSAGKVRGIAVHVAVRVTDFASAGEVLVTSTVRPLLKGSTLQFEDRSVQQLRGLPGEWALSAARRTPGDKAPRFES